MSVKNTTTIKLRELKTKTMPELAKKALGQAGLRAIRDIVLEAPRPPLETGFLRGSGVVYVEEKQVITSDRIGGNTGAKKGDVPSTNPQAEKLTLTIAMNTSYASAMDQELEPEGNKKSRFEQDSQIGGGFMSKKIADKKYQDTWTKIMANVFKEELGD